MGSIIVLIIRSAERKSHIDDDPREMSLKLHLLGETHYYLLQLNTHIIISYIHCISVSTWNSFAYDRRSMLIDPWYNIVLDTAVQ